ncbi:molybdenum ABC transporter ATP-binding protein [Pseudoprimorskyibacter insulae]|uniref:Molybdenum import ATP-binding protein ModC n=1 Tax=Pseudoprimorskyibacter insulae TaxID=1695997 RepID=A0A2R8AQA8_9RHOB|nr:molybdenum ABC transporter ATP-binding protein [Pseudoprimorskyibacter insulae]SPF78232.1 Molybdenum import ATP-binding protein ModC [Pseudoprimorskyibacter insulae]
MTLDVTLTHQFDGFACDVEFSAPAGITALFGHSGSGKTTIVNAVAGLLRPEAGRIVMDGQVLLDTAAGIDLPTARRRIGYVFQEARLFPHMTVRQNMLYGRWANRLRRDTAHEAQVIDLLGLGHLLTRLPGRLSGGESQRVALGRALLARPRMLLMDEPLAALDSARKSEILPYLERLRDDFGVPILYVSHSLSEVARLATTVVVVERGTVLRSGPAAEVLSDPEAAPSLGIREAGSILQGRLVGHSDDGLSEIAFSGGALWLPKIAANPGEDLRVRIAAGGVTLSRDEPLNTSSLNVLHGVIDTVRIGRSAGAMVRIRVGDEVILSRISARAAAQMALEAGQPIYACLASISVARSDIGQTRV